MTNPFSAAILWLRDGEQAWGVDYGSAIRVLERAGKVDKVNCLVELAGCGCKHCKKLRSLVDALPDKPGKEK